MRLCTYMLHDFPSHLNVFLHYFAQFENYKCCQFQCISDIRIHLTRYAAVDQPRSESGNYYQNL